MSTPSHLRVIKQPFWLSPLINFLPTVNQMEPNQTYPVTIRHTSPHLEVRVHKILTFKL